MDYRNSADHDLDNVWDRVRQRFTSANTLLVREARRLLDLPQPEAAAAIAPLLASEDIGRLRLLFTLLANVSQNLLTRETNRSGLTLARQQTATLLANLLGDRIKALGHPTKTLAPPALAKQAAYVDLTGRIIRLADWTASSPAEAEQIVAELEKLRAMDPPDYLAADISEALATTWVGIGDHLDDDPSKLQFASTAYGRAIEAYEAPGQVGEARKVRLKLVALIRKLVVDFDETIAQITPMLAAIEGQEPTLQHAQMRLELAQTYAAVGEIDAVRAQIAAAEADSWRCGWPQPDVNDIKGSFARWVAHAEATCNTDAEFAEALFTELTVEATVLALRARIASEVSERDAFSQAVQELAALEDRLTETTIAATNANATEQAAFVSDFGAADTKAQPWTLLPTSTSLGRLSALHAALDPPSTRCARNSGAGRSRAPPRTTCFRRSSASSRRRARTASRSCRPRPSCSAPTSTSRPAASRKRRRPPARRSTFRAIRRLTSRPAATHLTVSSARASHWTIPLRSPPLVAMRSR
jgi:hypothetical protein